MEMKGGTQAVVNSNGNFVEEEAVSSFKFSHLLASKDRDFLLSPTGTQVCLSFYSSHHFNFLNIHIHGLIAQNNSTVCHYSYYYTFFF
jgi:hypothetical protein